MSKATSGTKVAQKQFEVENKIKDVGNDEYYTLDQQKQQTILESRPWKSEYVSYSNTNHVQSPLFQECKNVSSCLVKNRTFAIFMLTL